MDLLTRVTGWDFKQACRRIEQHLGIAPPPKPTAKPKRPHRVPTPPPAGTPPPALGSAVAQFPYGPDRANPWYWVQRVPMPPKGDRPQKLFVQRTWLDSKWHYPSKRDGFASHWPEPRPIYRLPDLNDRPGDPVLISEGEGKTDDATHLFPEHVCVSWTGGTAGIAPAPSWWSTHPTPWRRAGIWLMRSPKGGPRQRPPRPCSPRQGRWRPCRMPEPAPTAPAATSTNRQWTCRRVRRSSAWASVKASTTTSQAAPAR
jgi:hypothetical protein